MRGKAVIVLLLAAVATAGCSASQLKAQKDNSWSHMPQALPDSYDSNPGGYAHPLRPVAFLLNPIGVALDYALVRPFHLLAGLAPEWFGLTADDGQNYHDHFPELVVSRDTPATYPQVQ
jgi:hypothetical protein